MDYRMQVWWNLNILVRQTLILDSFLVLEHEILSLSCNFLKYLSSYSNYWKIIKGQQISCLKFI